MQDLNFNERAELFKKAILRAQKKYKLVITAGYINSYDDSENLIIQEVVDQEIKNEVYFDTLAKEL